MHAEPGLVRDEAQLDTRRRRQLGHGIGVLQDRLVGVAAQHQVGDPHGEAIDDDRVGRRQRAAELRDEIVRRLHRAPVRRALGLVARDARGHVGVAGLRGGDVRDARARREARDREPALAAARAAENEE